MRLDKRKNSNFWKACILAVSTFIGISHSLASEEIVRIEERQNLFTTVKIPSNAELVFLSGAGVTSFGGPSRKPDGKLWSMEEQAEIVFEGTKKRLERVGFSLEDIVEVRVYALPDDSGEVDFAGFNTGYLKYFGTEENPTKPVRTFIQAGGLMGDGWLIEVDVRAAKI